MSNIDGGRRTAAKAKPAAPPARKRRTQAQRSDEMRQRLIEAAALVLRRKGYAGLRTEEVARVAKVSRGAQQHHFPTKDSLVLATAAHVLRSGCERGQRQAVNAATTDDPLEAIIQDAQDFFLGSEFGVVLDLVLAGGKDRNLRDQVYSHTRENRLTVEQAWLDLLRARGVPPAKAETVLWLTMSIVRGFAVRALWQRDDALFGRLLEEWKTMVSLYLQAAPTTAES